MNLLLPTGCMVALESVDVIFRTVVFLCLPAIIVFGFVLSAQAGTAVDLDESQKLFSPVTAQTFHETARHLAKAPGAGERQVAQAMCFLYAVADLDPRAHYVLEDVLRIGAQSSGSDYMDVVSGALARYIDRPNIDLVVARTAVAYMLDGVDSRGDRERILAEQIKAAEGKNPTLDSYLHTQLGFLVAEKADHQAATNHLLAACNANPFNSEAFTRLDGQTRLTGTELSPERYIDHLRRMLGVNPMNLDTAFMFARYAEQLEMYDTATIGYEYCADLYSYLNPDSDLPASIYLPWSLSACNSSRRYGMCVQIAERVRQSGRFDIVLQAIAARAAAKMGDSEQSRYLLQAGTDAEKMLADAVASGNGDIASGDVTSQQLAWFYCFADEHPEKALAWANKAYSAWEDSDQNRAIFAYALVINAQPELASDYLGQSGSKDQIATLAAGLVKLAASDKSGAIADLKTAIAMDPASLVAEKARLLLVRNDSEYVSTATPEKTVRYLSDRFDGRIVPGFVVAGGLMAAKLDMNGTEFSYGQAFDARLVVANNGSEPMLIADEGMFKGNIRVDAKVSGDMRAFLPGLVVRRICPGSLIEPGRYATMPLEVVTGPLRTLLLRRPQASFDVEFTVYLDPVIDAEGKVRCGIPGIEPIRATVNRHGVSLSQSYMIQRLEAISRGREGQKVRSVQLFAGLLAEQQLTERYGAFYRQMQVEKALLSDGIEHCLRDENWKVRIQAMASLLVLPRPVADELTQAAALGLHDKYWPVRLMAIYVLRQSSPDSFGQVLDWAAEYDTHLRVRAMAVALGGKESVKLLPAESPK